MSERQVDKTHYRFDRYGTEDRFISYFHQLQKVLSHNPASVLEIGVGDKVFGNFLKHNTAVSYTSLDVAEDLSPDVVGDILALPFPDKSFDVVCAFEVLEHLPFEKAEKALAELARVARTHVAISVPHFGPMLWLSFKIPFLPSVRLAYKIPYPRKHHFNGQHYWELGKRGYRAEQLRALLRRHGRIENEEIPFASPYHHFFILSLDA